MFSLGTVFHALAAVVLIWLVLTLVRMAADREFVRALFASRVTVDWLTPFLRRFCRIWGVPFENRCPAKAGEPARLRGRTLLEVHFHHGLKGIRIDQVSDRPSVTIRLQEWPKDPESVIHQLREALASEAIQLEP